MGKLYEKWGEEGRRWVIVYNIFTGIVVE